jgi:hypothetical protein
LTRPCRKSVLSPIDAIRPTNLGEYHVKETCLSGRGYYRKLVRADSVPAVGGYTVLINDTYPDFATVANGGKVQNANGYDIAFSSDAAGTNLLPYEVEKYTSTSGAVIMHVKGSAGLA